MRNGGVRAAINTQVGAQSDHRALLPVEGGAPHTSDDGVSPCRPPGDAILSRILVSYL